MIKVFPCLRRVRFQNPWKRSRYLESDDESGNGRSTEWGSYRLSEDCMGRPSGGVNGVKETWLWYAGITKGIASQWLFTYIVGETIMFATEHDEVESTA